MSSSVESCSGSGEDLREVRDGRHAVQISGHTPAQSPAEMIKTASAQCSSVSLPTNINEAMDNSVSHPVTSIIPVDVVIALYDFTPVNNSTSKNSQLSLQRGDTIYVLNKNESGWWDGIYIDSYNRVNRGWFPHTYSRSLNHSQQQQLQYRQKQQQQQQQQHQQQSQKQQVSKQQQQQQQHPQQTPQHISTASGKRRSQVRHNLSTHGIRRSSLPQQPVPQASPIHRRSSLSTGSPSRQLFAPHNSFQQIQAKSHGLRQCSPSPSQSSSVGSISISPFSYQFNFNDTQHVNRIGSDIASASQTRYNSLSGPSSSAGSHMGSIAGSNPRYNKAQHFQQQQATEQSHHEKINILSLEEIEMIFNSLHPEIPPIWSPIPASTMDKVVYYNKNFDIYCSQLPLIANSSLDSSSDFKTDDNLIDLSPRDLQDSSKSIDSKTFKLAPTYNSRNSIASKNSSLSSSTQMQAKDMRSGSSSTSTSYVYRVASESQAGNTGQQPLSNKGGRQKLPSTANTDADPIPPNYGKKKVNSVSSAYNRHSHKRPQAILSKPDLFYHHTMDIKLWSELRDTTLYFVTKTHNMFLRNNRLEYERSLNLVSAFLTYTQMACRLSYAQIKEKQLLREVKKILKRIINSLSTISINSSVYFGSFHRPFSSLNDTPRPSEASLKDEDLKKGTTNEVSEPLYKNPNVTDTDTLVGDSATYPPYAGYHVNLSGTDSYAESSSPQRNNSATTTRTSVPSIRGSPHDIPTSSAIIKNLYENLDIEFNHLIKAIQTLFLLLQTSIISNDWIPQLFPRFFKGSFNGGSWSNPFNQIHQTHESVSSQVSSPSGLPSNVAEAIAGVYGCPSVDCADTCRDANLFPSTSREKSIQSSQKTNTLSGFNRPLHHRTFSRSKASRNIQYPLNDNTANLMKKRYQSICEKLGAIKLFDASDNNHGTIVSKKKQLEIISQTYEEVSSCVLLEVLENLDLGIFVSLRTLITSNRKLDHESEEFLRHAFSTISSILTDFFDIKQLFHDSVVKFIMSAQQITLDDPYVFCSMRPKFPVGYFEPGLNPISQSHTNRIDKNVMEFYTSLISKDVEFNDMTFLRTSDEFIDCCAKYTQMAFVSCGIVEQLVESRENLLNYAARMMKNDLTAELLEGEQQKWFGDYEVFENEDGDETIERDSEETDEFSGVECTDDSSNPLKDKPWFLQSEYSKSFILDQRGRIKGGTSEALIEHLTSHEVIDAWFNVSMLITFRSMFTTREFLYALVYRYNLYPPEGLSYDEYNLWIEKKLNPIQCRVINIMKSLFSQYWTPAYYEPGISSILNFAQIAVGEKIPGAEELFEEISDNIAAKGVRKSTDGSSFFHEGGTVSDFNMNALSSFSSIHSSSPIIRLKKFKILDIDPRTYAAQLTLLEHSLYIRIPIFECLDRAWGTKYCDMGGSANITKFISSANNLTNYVSYAIVKEVEVKKRSALIQYFITVAQYCRELNNFSAMTAIVSALCSSPIYRLKKTWSHVSAECTRILRELNSLMDSKKNFINYRELVRSVIDVPCVPFFGVYLSDLTFTFGGNPDFLHRSSDIINFGKRARIVDILEEIMSFKRIHYKFKRYDDIQSIIESSLEKVPHIEKQYELSLLIEPRTDDQGRPSAVNPIKGNVFDPKAASDVRNGRLLKFGKKKSSSRLF